MNTIDLIKAKISELCRSYLEEIGKAKISKRQLSRDLGVSYQTIDYWIKGESFPTLDTLQEIVKKEAHIDFVNRLALLTAALAFVKIDDALAVFACTDEKKTISIENASIAFDEVNECLKTL